MEDYDELKRQRDRIEAKQPDRLLDFARSAAEITEEQLASMDLTLARDTIRALRALAQASIG